MKEYLHHFFLPRESNNHRAKLLHHSTLFFLIAFFFLGGLVIQPIQRSHPDVLGIATNISVDKLLELTNKQRVDHGLTSLSLNTELTNAAAGKAQDMFTKNYWAHFAPDGGTPWGFIHGAGYQYIYAGENLARGFTSSDDVVNAWMASPGHRENLLSPNYKEIGFAIQSGTLTGEDTTLVVQMFGSRSSTQQVQVQAVTTIPTPMPTSAPVASTSSAPEVIVTTVPQSSPPVVVVTPVQLQHVAAISNNPLVNTKPFAQSVMGILLSLFIFVLLIDFIVIKRRRIVRIVSHNLDHIIYFAILFVALVIISKGAIL